MYAPGVRRHIRHALEAGATIEEIFEVLKLCVSQGVQSCNLGVPKSWPLVQSKTRHEALTAWRI